MTDPIVLGRYGAGAAEAQARLDAETSTPRPSAQADIDDFFDVPAVKMPGQWRRLGDNGPPLVTDINGTTVQSGPRRGLLTLKTYSRPSGFGKQVENTFALAKWQQRQGVIGMFLEPTLLDEMAALWNEPDHNTTAWKRAVDGVYLRAARAAGAMVKAEQGTHGHYVTEDNDLGRSVIGRIEAGENIGLSPELQRCIVTVWDRLVDEHFEILAVEFPCVYDRWRVAGTGDRIVRTKHDLHFRVGGGGVTIPAGTVITLDVKTGGLKLDHHGIPSFWLSYAVQVAAYARSVPYDVDSEHRGTWPWPISLQHAVIAHIDIGGALDTDVLAAQLFYVDIAAGHDAGELVCDAKAWQRRRDVFSPANTYLIAETLDVPPPPRLAPVDLLSVESVGPRTPLSTPRASDVDLLSVEPAEPSPQPSAPRATEPVGIAVRNDTGRPAIDVVAPALNDVPAVRTAVRTTSPGDPEVREWLRGRVRAILDHNDVARQQLARRWPDGVPGLKGDHPHTADELEAINVVVAVIERDYSIPFGAPDPRAGPPELPSWVDKMMHPSATVAWRDTLAVIDTHPRRALLERWEQIAAGSGHPVDHLRSTTRHWGILNTLVEWLALDDADDDVTHLLDGAIRALGHDAGIADVGCLTDRQARELMAAAFAVTAGTATLAYRDGLPVLVSSPF